MASVLAAFGAGILAMGAVLLMGRGLWWFLRDEIPSNHGLVEWALAGLVALYGFYYLAFLSGLPWGRGLWIGVVVALGLLGGLPRGFKMPRWGYGDAAVSIMLIALTVALLKLWLVHPDFVFHWGFKAKRFYFVQGIDWQWMKESSRWWIQPDYPLLVPFLHHFSAVVKGGAFSERAAMMWTPFYLFLILGAAGDVGRSFGQSFSQLQGTRLILGAYLVVFTFHYRMGGLADWLITLCLMVGAGLLMGKEGEPRWAKAALVMTLAAVTKTEGLFFVAIFGILYLGKYRRHWRRAGICILPALVLLGQQIQIGRLGLRVSRLGSPSWESAERVGIAIFHTLSEPPLGGVEYIPFLAFLMVVSPRFRTPLALVCGQFLAYLFVYLLSSFEPEFYVASTLFRLLFHGLPVLLVLSMAKLWCWVPQPVKAIGGPEVVSEC